MPSQIRPTRLEVSDRFPMLGFAIKTDGSNKRYEVAIASDPGLFQSDAKAKRTKGTFYSSRGAGFQPIERGEAVYVVPPEVLARFAGQEKLYFALATYANGKGGPEIAAVPTPASPYISLKSLSGRSLRRVRVLPNRQRQMSSYQNGAGSDLEWGGDVATPGTQQVAAVAPVNGIAKPADPAAAAAHAAAFEYNDGFGPLPPAPKAKTKDNGRVAAAKALEDDDSVSPDTDSVIALLGSQAQSSASALVFDADDVEAATKYAPKWADLIKYKAPASVESGVVARGMSVQKIEDALGDLNLDFYPVRITSLPTVDGATLDSAGLFNYVRLHVNDFVDTAIGKFVPYTPGTDDAAWNSGSPVGTVFKIILAGPKNAAVVASLSEARRWRFTTVHTDDTGDHPVTGHREFGFMLDGDGNTIMYARGADRSTGILESSADFVTFGQGDKMWKSFQSKLTDFVNNNGGAAAPVPRFSQRFKWSVVNIILSPQGSSAQALSAYRTERKARALDDESYTLNWDDVQLIAQPADMSCWAASAAMVVGWRDQVSLTPETIAKIGGRSTASGLDPAQVQQFASEIGLAFESPQSYTIEGFRGMLEKYGPLWVGADVPGLHVIVVTGMYSDGAADGSNTYVRITDPWDRVTGTPGAPGAYLTTHSTGSRYIMSWADFVKEYESTTRFSAVNLQILHSTGTGGKQPNRGSAAGYAMSVANGRFKRHQGRALAYESFTLNWDDVESIAQPTDATCWAASGAMVVGWRDQVSLAPETLANICGRSTVTGLDPNQRRQFATEIGLSYEEPQSYTIDGFRNLLETYGPLWVSVQLPGSGHAIVVTGLYSDGAADGSDTYVRISDPWDRVVGKPGSPGGYLNTHNTGSRYIMSWADFTSEYEARASTAPDGTVNAQILHAASSSGRTPNRTGAAGYAMSLSVPERFDRYKPRRASYSTGRALEVDVPLDAKKPAQLPKARKLGAIEGALVNAGLAVIAPMLPAIRTAANAAGLCMAVGPAAGAAFAAGGGASAGVLFAANGDIGIYGSFDVRGGFDFGASVGLQITLVRGGIDEFNEVNLAIAVGWEEGIDATVMALFNGESFRGITFELGVGISVEPLKIYAAIEKSVATTVATAKSLGDGVLRLAPPPKPKAKAMEGGVAVAVATKIGEVVIEKIMGNDGSITWSLDQLRGLKHPNDTAPSSAAAFKDAATIRLNDWPYVEALDGDQISAWFSVDWQYNGKSLGNVAISNIGTNGALLRKLSVDAKIMDDNIVYPTANPTYAALKVRIYYRFSRAIGSDEIATLDLHLYGDGTYEQSGRWEQ